MIRTRALRGVAVALSLLGVALVAVSQESAISIRANHVFDGRGGEISRPVVLVIRAGKIASIEPGTAARGAVYDLTGLWVLPGLIDLHDHLAWHFNREGRLHNEGDGESPAEAALASAANAYATLRAGFTTVQSPGSDSDRELRDAIERRGLAGPRLLTSLEPLNEKTGPPERLREEIRKRKAAGADLIKLFASKSIREGGAQTMSDEQLAAACGEAAALGLRTLVHAHSPESVRAAVLAGCTQIEHGIFATPEVLKLMAERGTYFDPQCGLVFHNYLENKPKFLGIGNYTEEGFAAMARAVPLAVETFRRAIATPNLKVVFGTDAVAGAHGSNVEELVCRARDGGQPVRDALVSATSLAAESLKLGDSIGAIAPGMRVDVIAVAGDPTRDVLALKRVVFVMKDGRVFENAAPPMR